MDTRCPLYFKPADLMAAFSSGVDIDPHQGSTRPARRPDGEGPWLGRRLSGILSRSISALSARPAWHRESTGSLVRQLATRPALGPEPGSLRSGFMRAAHPARAALSSHFVLGTANGE